MSFYTHITDPLLFACKLTKTVYNKKQGLLIWLPDTQSVMDFDNRLWRFEAESFIPHQVLNINKSLTLNTTDIIIGSGSPPKDCPLQTVLNLSDYFFGNDIQFNRILELIEHNEQSMNNARDRFRAYKQCGFELEHFNMEHKS
ncbi:DNA polymerase III subunit chi [Neisseria sp. Ec49-e6-T10]|uniref:DNA polymerase III subunit chi n=1 Tax=Neisseria sp. Ec49-e6-T10 TaxID=3140744 RepID=UPI003EBC1CC1